VITQDIYDLWLAGFVGMGSFLKLHQFKKKSDEIRHEGDLELSVWYISLIKKRALKIFCMVPFFYTLTEGIMISVRVCPTP